jgi:flagellar protein FlaJ
MALTEVQRLSYKVLGPWVTRALDTGELEQDLAEARMGVRAEAYLAHATFMAIVVTVVGLLLSATAAVVLPQLGMAVPAVAYAAMVAVPPLLGIGTFAVVQATPGFKASRRANNIDMKIPYALNYVSAMASAGVNIDEIFRALAGQEVYGECAEEALAIYRDIEYFGKDSVTAMKRAIERTPSDKWSEFLQGAITTVTSGGDLTNYFQSKAERYMWENRQEQKKFVDTMGLMAETYVTAAVAGPLFLIVMMAIMGMLGGEGPEKMYLIVYFLLPVVNVGFAFGLQAVTPEV